MSEEKFDEVMREILAERQKMKQLPVLAVRYSVIQTPVKITDADGHYQPPDPIRVSPYFGSMQDALDWIEKHKDPTVNLTVRTQYLREFTEQRWSSF